MWTTANDADTALHQATGESGEDPGDWYPEALYDLDHDGEHDAEPPNARRIQFTWDLRYTFELIDPPVPDVQLPDGPLAVAVRAAQEARAARRAQAEAEAAERKRQQDETGYLAHVRTARQLAGAALAEFANQLTWKMGPGGAPQATHPELPGCTFVVYQHNDLGTVLGIERRGFHLERCPVRELADLVGFLR